LQYYSDLTELPVMERFMRIKATWISAAAVIGTLMLGGGSAHAGITCKLVPGMCPAGDPPGSAAVPEPTTIALLTTGFAAAGVAAWRRRKRKD
jgi:hypothetical protein